MALTTQLKKFIKSLHINKYRQKYNKFIVEGPKVCEEFIISRKFEIKHICCVASWKNENANLLQSIESYKVIEVNDKELNQISCLKRANQVLIVCEKDQEQNRQIKTDQWAIFLDNIQDPGNLGTIIRTADWYGVKSIITNLESADFYNPKVIQSAMGSHCRVHLTKLNQNELIQLDAPIYALTLGGNPIDQVNNLQPGIIAIGNESKGLSQTIISGAKKELTIRRIGGAESLNAAVATGITCQLLLQPS